MKNLKKLAAAVLAVTVSAAATGSIAYAKNSDKTDKTDSTAKTEGEKETSERESNGENAYKDETVYVMCNNDASVKNVVVSDWLKNPSALTSLSDISSLEDIVNVKGDEAFTVNGEDISWSADGSDIYYKGNSDKELPVDVNIQYFLDGKEVTADSIKGKSGHLTIRWTYTNNQKVTKEIGGKNKEIYVPFMAASAAVLDTSKFTNVEVTNGKVISTGEQLIVVGLGFPGLSDSLGLDEIDGLDVDIPESFELSADVTDFGMNSSVTVVSNEIFSQLDIDEDTTESELKDKIKELSDGAEQLVDGTAALYDGISQLADGSGDLTSGIDQLADGSAKLSSGAAELSSGSKALGDGAKTLNDSTGTLVNGISSAKSGSASLVDGAAQLADGAGSLTGGFAQVTDGSASLVDGLSQLKDGQYIENGTVYNADGTKTDITGLTYEKDGQTVTADGLRVVKGSKDGENKLEIFNGTTETIQVDRDTDQIIEGIKSFVDEYNKLIKTLNDYLDEDTSYKEYAPLTDAQKKEMSEKEIELWEEKAKEGLLHRDSTIDSFLQSMRTALYEKPEGCAYAL